MGLGLARAATERGLSVVVVERDEWATGASVRNFGHVGTTAQAGVGLEHALVAREVWLQMAEEAGVWVKEAGTVVVARAADELAVLEEFADERGDQVQLLTAAEAEGRTGSRGATGGAWFPMDLRVDPRTASARVAAWLADRGVEFAWRTAAQVVGPGELVTTRGTITAKQVFVAVGHDVDRWYPQVADEAGLVRCALQMLTVAAPGARQVEPAVLTGFSLLRYDGFAGCRTLGAVRERLALEHAGAVEAGLNLMFTQRPGGDLVIGDTHAYARTHDPFVDERLAELVGDYAGDLLGEPGLEVHQRWRGIYASARQPFLVAEPEPGVTVVSVTSGIGMTTAFGFTSTVMEGAWHQV